MKLEKIMEIISRLAFASAGLVLMAMSLALVVYGAIEVISAGASSWKDAGGTMLAAIGYVVIAMAVFDVAKYFIEEEVIRGREMRNAGEARRSLTKFVSTIAIAVFIEGLVIVFQASKDDVATMIYPTGLLLAAILIVVGLGVFQRLSADVENKVHDPGKSSKR
jgi:L-asparagine transporter-like permease